jgi:hypothetical protein
MMESLQDEGEGLQYKIVPPETEFLIGPQSVHTTDLSRRVVYKLGLPRFRRQKRIFDMGASLLLLLTYPLLFWRYRKPGRAIGNILASLTGRKHVVGYVGEGNADLPKMKKGVLSMLHRGDGAAVEGLNVAELDAFYSRDWSWGLDMEILLKGWREI